MVILLTGGTGFLGRHLLDTLDDFDLRVITRSPESIQKTGIDIVRGDITKELPDDLFDDVDTFIHSAAKVGSWPKDPMSGYYQTNVLATRHLISKAIDLKIKKIVYTSSYFAIGHTGELLADESWDQAPQYPHPYVSTKYEAGKIVDQLAKNYPITQLHPTVIIGPGIDNVISATMIDYINGRLPGLPGGGENYLNFVSVDDVATAHLKAITTDHSGKYLIGGENMTMGQFFTIIADKLEINPPRSIPHWIASVYAKTLEILHHPSLTTADVNLTRLNYRYDCSKSEELQQKRTPISRSIDELLVDMLHRGRFNRKGERRVLQYLNEK